MGGADQQIDELGVPEAQATQLTQAAMDSDLAAQLQDEEEKAHIQAAADSAMAADLQDEEEQAHGTASTPNNASCKDSLRQSRTDEEMKELLKTLQVPHHVRKSKTHGQNNCLIDSILLALQDQKCINPLEVYERAAVCSSIRRHLIEHHDVAPENPDGSQSYLSHEDSFDAICNQLRSEHPDIWSDDIDETRLPIVAYVFDRFHRRQLYDDSGAWTGELEEMNAPVVSLPLSASNKLPEVNVHLYCNTLDDAHGTPYHYEWISFGSDGSEEEEESGVEEDDDENNPAPLPLLTSDTEDDDDDNRQAPPVPELPLRTQLSTLSLCAFVSFLLIVKTRNNSSHLPQIRKCVRVRI